MEVTSVHIVVALKIHCNQWMSHLGLGRKVGSHFVIRIDYGDLLLLEIHENVVSKELE